MEKSVKDILFSIGLCNDKLTLTIEGKDVPVFMGAEYKHYESNVNIFQKNLEEQIGREMSESEYNVLKNILISYDGHYMLDVVLATQLFFTLIIKWEEFKKES